MLDRLRAWSASDSAKRVYRTFVIAFAGVALPGALGWLHGLTEWARSQGQTPFPDARSLAFLGVAAIAAGFVALLNLVVVFLEDASGTGVLRDVPDKQLGARGAVDALYLALFVLVVLVIIFMITVLL